MTPTPPLLCPQSREFAAPPKAPSAEPSFSGYDCAQAPCGSPARWPAAAAPESETEVGPGPAAHEIAFLCAARRRGPRGLRTGGDGCGSPREHPCSCSWAPQAPVPQTATPGAPPASRGPPQGAPHTAMGRNSGQEPTGRTEGTVLAPETQCGRAGSLPATLSLTLLPQGPAPCRGQSAHGVPTSRVMDSRPRKGRRLARVPSGQRAHWAVDRLGTSDSL